MRSPKIYWQTACRFLPEINQLDLSQTIGLMSFLSYSAMHGASIDIDTVMPQVEELQKKMRAALTPRQTIRVIRVLCDLAEEKIKLMEEAK